MKIERGQVFVIDYHVKDRDTIERKYDISDGRIWREMECTSEVLLEE